MFAANKRIARMPKLIAHGLEGAAWAPEVHFGTYARVKSGQYVCYKNESASLTNV
jgi:hypothetical protein